MKRATIWIIVVLAGFAATLQSAPLGKYVVTGMTITDLGSLGGVDREARDINDNGVIVGWSETAQGKRHAFSYRPYFGMLDLGAWFGAGESVANGINNDDAVVGSWWLPGSEAHAAYWNGSSALLLTDVIDPSEVTACKYGSEAMAINDSGRITGYIALVEDLHPSDPAVCILWGNAAQWTSATTPSLLTDDVTSSIGFNINNAGVIVGDDMIMGAVRWTSGTLKTVPFPPKDPPDISWNQGVAYAVNNVGRVVGYFVQIVHTGESTFTSREHAFLWNGTSTTSTDLGILSSGNSSVARDVNDGGFVAGYANKLNASRTGGLGLIRNVGFIWHPHFGMKALPRLSGSLLGDACEAYALNDRNANGLIQVVGYCSVEGNRHAVRWNVTTVISSPPCPTPTC